VWIKTKNFGLVTHKERREKREKREEREHVEERREEREGEKLVCVTKPKFLVMVHTSVSLNRDPLIKGINESHQ
jgi:mRNA degradation ribonuclease J1/J2